jgi:hypothetical protein
MHKKAFFTHGAATIILCAATSLISLSFPA